MLGSIGRTEKKSNKKKESTKILFDKYIIIVYNYYQYFITYKSMNDSIPPSQSVFSALDNPVTALMYIRTFGHLVPDNEKMTKTKVQAVMNGLSGTDEEINREIRSTAGLVHAIYKHDQEYPSKR